jgi:hypothetical protein
MSNMGHCRFTNTLADLKDCQEHLDDKLSPEETKARQHLIRLCSQIAGDYESELEAILENSIKPSKP